MLTQSVSATNTSAPVPRVAVTASQGLVKSSNGEITAASVESNPMLSAGLVKLKDGNYSLPIVSPAERAASAVALNSLKLGG